MTPNKQRTLTDLLDSELRPYAEVDRLFGPDRLLVSHPWVRMVVDGPDTAAFANRMFEEKRRAIASRLERKDWEGYLWLFERYARLPALQALAVMGDPRTIRDKRWAKLVRDVWTDTEFPHRYADVVAEMLYSGEPHHLRLQLLSTRDEIAELHQHATETGELVVFRGVGSDAPSPVGFAWTLDENTATWFAKRFDPTGGQVISATVTFEEVLGYFPDRGEAEVLLTHTSLQRISASAAGAARLRL